MLSAKSIVPRTPVSRAIVSVNSPSDNNASMSSRGFWEDLKRAHADMLVSKKRMETARSAKLAELTKKLDEIARREMEGMTKQIGGGNPLDLTIMSPDEVDDVDLTGLYDDT